LNHFFLQAIKNPKCASTFYSPRIYPPINLKENDAQGKFGNTQQKRQKIANGKTSASE
jgi:hypothetical protein